MLKPPVVFSRKDKHKQWLFKDSILSKIMFIPWKGGPNFHCVYSHIVNKMADKAL